MLEEGEVFLRHVLRDRAKVARIEAIEKLFGIPGTQVHSEAVDKVREVPQIESLPMGMFHHLLPRSIEGSILCDQRVSECCHQAASLRIKIAHVDDGILSTKKLSPTTFQTSVEAIFPQLS